MSASPEITKDAASAAYVDPFPFKAFVSNLPYSTSDEELKEFFSEVGPVLQARVVTYGTRSKGYGFVSFADQPTLDQAIKTMDGAELSGRPLKVSPARPLTEKPRSPTRRPRRHHQKQPRTENKENGGAAGDASAVSQEESASGAEKKQEGNDSTAAPRRHHPRRQSAKPRNADDGSAPAKESCTPSDTVLFVGNLPFSTTDGELAELFTGLSVESAHVVINKRNNRPKGYGFVTFNTPQDQGSAIKRYGTQSVSLGERVLNIKAAVSESPAVEQ